MELLIDEEEIKEITLDNFINPNDNAKITIIGENVGKRDEGKDDIVKEIIANDALMLGPSRAAELHGIPQSSASKYSNGQDIADEDTRSRVLGRKYDIAELATAKLMNALELFDPNAIEKPRDLINAASALSNIVDKVSGQGKGGNKIELHLYAPKQNDIRKYGDVIDV